MSSLMAGFDMGDEGSEGDAGAGPAASIPSDSSRGESATVTTSTTTTAIPVKGASAPTDAGLYRGLMFGRLSSCH